MARFRKVIAIVALLAVATNSAAAGLRPRCCRTELSEPPKHACCDPAEAQPAQTAPASCCHAKQAVSARSEDHVTSSGWALTMGMQPCCCVKSLPAVPSVRESAAVRDRPDVQPALIGDALSRADVPSVQARIRDCRPGRFVAAAPSISVLYCVWLK